jgi:hypothetical protein
MPDDTIKHIPASQSLYFEGLFENRSATAVVSEMSRIGYANRTASAGMALFEAEPSIL